MQNCLCIGGAEAEPAAIGEPDLHARVTALWSRYRSVAIRQTRTRAELAQIRAEMGAYLSEKKARLAGAGGEGEWRPWLASCGIPRSTAERLIARHRYPLSTGAGDGGAHLPVVPAPPELEPAAGAALVSLRPLVAGDQFRCLEFLGPALGLACRLCGRHGDLLIERPHDAGGRLGRPPQAST